jgi:hypothetical protein
MVKMENLPMPFTLSSVHSHTHHGKQGHPRHHTIHLPHKTVHQARRSFLRFARKLKRREITALATTLKRGHFNGCVAERDLPGTIARLRRIPRSEVIKMFRFNPNPSENPLAYWTFQICGGLKPEHDDYVATSIAWCSDALKKHSGS